MTGDVSEEVSQEASAGTPNESVSPRVREDVLVTELDGEAVVFHAPSDTVLKMNASATTVWACCDGSATVGEIASDIAEVYGVDRATVLSQVADLVGQWSRRGLLDLGAGDPAGTDASTTGP
ncbi:MAG: PqqD family protein [Acidimicrobiales bacterium]